MRLIPPIKALTVECNLRGWLAIDGGISALEGGYQIGGIGGFDFH
jgi:hypothetical protein